MQSLQMPLWVWPVVLTAVCGAAVWKGGPSERAAGLIYYAGWLLTRLARHDNRHYPQLGEFAVDLAALTAMVILALRSHRWWPMAMAGLTLLVATTHAGRLLDAGLSSWAYYTALQMWTYLGLTVLAVATWQRWNERPADRPPRPPPVDQAAGRRNR